MPFPSYISGPRRCPHKSFWGPRGSLPSPAEFEEAALDYESHLQSTGLKLEAFKVRVEVAPSSTVSIGRVNTYLPIYESVTKRLPNSVTARIIFTGSGAVTTGLDSKYPVRALPR